MIYLTSHICLLNRQQNLTLNTLLFKLFTATFHLFTLRSELLSVFMSHIIYVNINSSQRKLLAFKISILTSLCQRCLWSRWRFQVDWSKYRIDFRLNISSCDYELINVEHKIESFFEYWIKLRLDFVPLLLNFSIIKTIR